MKYLILLCSLLFCGVAQADEPDEVDPYLGTYTAYVQAGFKEGVPSCATVKRGEKYWVKVSVKKNSKGEFVIKDNGAHESELIDFRLDDNQLLIQYSDWSTIFREDGRRTVLLRPWENDKKHRGEIAIVMSAVNKHNEELCWTSLLGVGRFTPQKK